MGKAGIQVKTNYEDVDSMLCRIRSNYDPDGLKENIGHYGAGSLFFDVKKSISLVESELILSVELLLLYSPRRWRFPYFLLLRLLYC